MELVILDKNQKEIERLNLQDISKIRIPERINITSEVDEGTKNLLNNLDYGVSVYSYIENIDDFSISFFNNKILNFHVYELSNFIGNLVSDITSYIDKKGLLLTAMKEVYKTGKTQTYLIEYYNDDELIRNESIKILKVNNFVYILFENKTNNVFLFNEDENIYNSNIMGISIVQNYRYVNCNKKYRELVNIKSFDDIIGKKMGFTGLFDDSLNLMYDIIDDITKGYNFSYSFSAIEVKQEDKLRYFNLICNHVIYKGKPAVMIFCNDITEQELNKKEIINKEEETLDLKDKLVRIQNVSKTGMSYSTNNGITEWSKSAIDLFKLDSKRYKKYYGNLLDIVLEEDIHYWKEAHEKCSPNNPEESYLIRIINGEGNLAYIKSYIVCDYDQNGKEIGHINFYQDVTEEIDNQNQLETALNDKEVLLSEVHHRVKNNLQIIISLINLNKNYQTDPEIILNDTETRIYAMALIHEKIYGSTSLSDVNMKEYTESLVHSLFDIYWSKIF